MTSPSKVAGLFLAALGFFLALFAPAPRMLADSRDATNDRVPLHDGWMLQSSCKVAAKGAQISVTGFRTDGWHATTVPATVVAALGDERSAVDVLTRRMAASVLLVKALGGGWKVSQIPPL